MGNRELLLKKNQENKRVISNVPEKETESTTLVDKLVEDYKPNMSDANEKVTADESKTAPVQVEVTAENNRKTEPKESTNEKGAGRKPSKYPRKITTFSLSSLTIRQIKEISMNSEIGMNRVLELAVDRYFNEISPSEKDRVEKIVGYKISETNPDGYIPV